MDNYIHEDDLLWLRMAFSVESSTECVDKSILVYLISDEYSLTKVEFFDQFRDLVPNEWLAAGFALHGQYARVLEFEYHISFKVIANGIRGGGFDKEYAGLYKKIKWWYHSEDNPQRVAAEMGNLPAYIMLKDAHPEGCHFVADLEATAINGHSELEEWLRENNKIIFKGKEVRADFSSIQPPLRHNGNRGFKKAVKQNKLDIIAQFVPDREAMRYIVFYGNVSAFKLCNIQYEGLHAFAAGGNQLKMLKILKFMGNDLPSGGFCNYTMDSSKIFKSCYGKEVAPAIMLLALNFGTLRMVKWIAKNFPCTRQMTTLNNDWFFVVKQRKFDILEWAYNTELLDIYIYAGCLAMSGHIGRFKRDVPNNIVIDVEFVMKLFQNNDVKMLEFLRMRSQLPLTGTIETFDYEPEVSVWIVKHRKEWLHYLHTVSIRNGYERILNRLTKAGYVRLVAPPPNTTS